MISHCYTRIWLARLQSLLDLSTQQMEETLPTGCVWQHMGLNRLPRRCCQLQREAQRGGCDERVELGYGEVAPAIPLTLSPIVPLTLSPAHMLQS